MEKVVQELEHQNKEPIKQENNCPFCPLESEIIDHRSQLLSTNCTCINIFVKFIRMRVRNSICLYESFGDTETQ